MYLVEVIHTYLLYKLIQEKNFTQTSKDQLTKHQELEFKDEGRE
jgi:hypothetical protein